MQKTLALSQSKTSLMPPLFIEVSLLSHESVMYMCLRAFYFASFFLRFIFLLYFGTVLIS
jgi:hypothetical protein